MASRMPRNEAPSNEDEVVPGRYSYRPAGPPPVSSWRLLAPGAAPLNTRAGHDSVVAEFNEEEAGKWVWRWNEVLPCDFDYPYYLPPEQGPRHIAACIWLSLDKEKRELDLADLLKRLPGERQTVLLPRGQAMAPGKGQVSEPAGVDYPQGKAIQHETYAHPEQAALVAMLANLEIRGEVELPAENVACIQWSRSIEKRLADARTDFDSLAGSRTGTDTLRDAAAGLLMQWFLHGRR